jgi:hypothetical protein
MVCRGKGRGKGEYSWAEGSLKYTARYYKLFFGLQADLFLGRGGRRGQKRLPRSASPGYATTPQRESRRASAP